MAWLNRLVWLLGGHDIKANLVVVGLPGSGKSTIMHQIKPREVRMIRLSPTLPMCCAAEKFTSKSLTFVAFDLGETDGFGNPWEDFYKDCHGAIFVIDGTDRLNIPLVAQQLRKMLDNPSIKDKNIPLLFLANKCDQGSTIHSLQLVDMLGLNALVKKPWCIFATSAITGEGLNEAFDWFAHKLRSTRRFSV